MFQEYKIKEELWVTFGRTLSKLFYVPWISMVGWGAFLHTSGIDLPFLSYWSMFFLNMALTIIAPSIPFAWRIKST